MIHVIKKKLTINIRESAVQIRRSLHYLVKRNVMISCDVDGPFFRNVTADPQRITDCNVVATVRHLRWWFVFVRDNRFADVYSYGTVDVDNRRMWYNHCSAHVVFIYIYDQRRVFKLFYTRVCLIFVNRKMPNTHQLRVELRSDLLYLLRPQRLVPRQLSLRPLSQHRRKPHRALDGSTTNQ